MYFLVCPLPIVIIADFIINILMKKAFITGHARSSFDFDEARGLISSYPLLISLSKNIYPEYAKRSFIPCWFYVFISCIPAIIRIYRPTKLY